VAAETKRGVRRGIQLGLTFTDEIVAKTTKLVQRDGVHSK
jgi:hypothetical protein